MKTTNTLLLFSTLISGVSCMHQERENASAKAFPYAPVSDPETRAVYESFMASPEMPDLAMLLQYDWSCKFYDFAPNNWTVAEYNLRFVGNASNATVVFPANIPTAGTAKLYDHALPTFRAARLQVENSSVFKDAIFRFGKIYGTAERPTLRIAHTTTEVPSAGTYVLFSPDSLNYQVLGVSECLPTNARHS